jgi:repressor LexA
MAALRLALPFHSCHTLPMPKEILPATYACDCGFVARFTEDSVKEVKQRSLDLATKQWLVSGEGFEKHLVMFEAGQLLTVLCPKGTRRPQAQPRERFSSLQGRYLAFIHQYTQVHGVAPAEIDMQTFFKVSPPTVHQMVLTLERKGFIERTPGQARSIKVLVPAGELPPLK